MKSIKVLAFDTTGSGISAAILKDQKIISSKEISASNMQAEILIPTIEECLNEAKIWYQDLDLLAVTNGPGSFTAIRVGFVSAKALKLATNLPLIAVSSLQAIAYEYKNSGYEKILVVMDAKLDELFIQEFFVENNTLKSILEPQLISLGEIVDFLPKEKFLLAGNAGELISGSLKNHQYFSSEKNDYVSATNVALLAQDIYKNNPKEINSDALYIRKPRISERKK
jgi:tRNA threonylcarbamoyladenosine biosynthesis protein TsaB